MDSANTKAIEAAYPQYRGGWTEAIAAAYKARKILALPRILFVFFFPSSSSSLLKYSQETFVEWHRDNKSFLEKYRRLFLSASAGVSRSALLLRLRNDASYRLLAALVVNSFSLRQLSWRERCKFRSDWIKPGWQLTCSEVRRKFLYFSFVGSLPPSVLRFRQRQPDC